MQRSGKSPSAAGTSTPQTMTLFTPFSKTSAVLSKPRNRTAHIPHPLCLPNPNRTPTRHQLTPEQNPTQQKPEPKPARFPLKTCTAMNALTNRNCPRTRHHPEPEHCSTPTLNHTPASPRPDEGAATTPGRTRSPARLLSPSSQLPFDSAPTPCGASSLEAVALASHGALRYNDDLNSNKVRNLVC